METISQATIRKGHYEENQVCNVSAADRFFVLGLWTILSSDTMVNLEKNEKWVVNQEFLFEGESFEEFGQTLINGLNLLADEGLNTGLNIEFKQLPDRKGNIPN